MKREVASFLSGSGCFRNILARLLILSRPCFGTPAGLIDPGGKVTELYVTAVCKLCLWEPSSKTLLVVPVLETKFPLPL